MSPNCVIAEFTDNESSISDRSNVFAVEIKFLMGDKKHVLSVHYTTPKYYIAQIIFEMKALQVPKTLYCSYSKQSMVELEITFDEGLWDKMWQLTLKLYKKVNFKNMVKHTKESKELKSRLEDFARNNCKYWLKCHHAQHLRESM